MSANLVKNKHATHTIKDDLESSFYVIFWVALMYTESYMTTPTQSLLIKEVFEAEEIEGIGSNTKSAFLISRCHITSNVFVGHKVLDRLIFALAELFALRYILITNEEQDATATSCQSLIFSTSLPLNHITENDISMDDAEHQAPVFIPLIKHL
ncbi:hypothetical protein BDR06DRAFT_1004152 [Suillus hirtellus]|nr:hypothetical protein BDR06DRAFT_1004152 [Suillus hirtellus]